MSTTAWIVTGVVVFVGLMWITKGKILKLVFEVIGEILD